MYTRPETTKSMTKDNQNALEVLSNYLKNNPDIENIFKNKTLDQAKDELGKMVLTKPLAIQFQREEITGIEAYKKLNNSDKAAIRILDYLQNSGRKIKDFNLHDKIDINAPFELLWDAINHQTEIINIDFVEDMIHLFKQFKGEVKQQPSLEKLKQWMQKYPNGLEQDIVNQRIENRDRIIKIIINQIDEGKINSQTFQFPKDSTQEEKFNIASCWWHDYKFHLKFAIRDPEVLNQMLDYTLDENTMSILRNAKKQGIPFFVNPYYLSLLDIKNLDDQSIRTYIIYSMDLVNEFGRIRSWEHEDSVVPGEPNAAGWILPKAHMIHRRYPEVAILIPQTVGRACGGLCTSCQRFYGFQNGVLQFDLDSLKPKQSWKEELQTVMDYFLNDSQLCDILITGGDALMSSDQSLKEVFDAVTNMAIQKKEMNKKRANGEKYAELIRVRIGTRLPVYLPQRITPELINILSNFKKEAGQAGVQQFIIQTHFQSPLEITPEVKEGINRLLTSGMMITNQLVFTTATSRRGHNAKLRKDLNDIGVLPYYTFTTKGGFENVPAFATNARNVMESEEEKIFGNINHNFSEEIQSLPLNPEKMIENIAAIQKKANIPFLATDKSVFNLPGLGKSSTFRAIGITADGRRILEFDHDVSRRHSPLTEQIGRVLVVESRSIKNYLDHLEAMGEDPEEYSTIWNYSLGQSEIRQAIYEYPHQDGVTSKMTNIAYN